MTTALSCSYVIAICRQANSMGKAAEKVMGHSHVMSHLMTTLFKNKFSRPSCGHKLWTTYTVSLWAVKKSHPVVTLLQQLHTSFLSRV